MSEDRTPYCYLFVRDDLSRVYGAVQACHAAIGGGQHLIPSDIPHPHLVMLSVASEEELLQACVRLDQAGIRHYLFTEPDIGDQATALITEPVYGSMRRTFRRYRCVKS